MKYNIINVLFEYIFLIKKFIVGLIRFIVTWMNVLTEVIIL